MQDLYVTAVGVPDSPAPRITKKGNIGFHHPAIGHKPETLINTNKREQARTNKSNHTRIGANKIGKSSQD